MSRWPEGETPQTVIDSVSIRYPLQSDELEDLRWYLEDYLSTPFAVYGERGPQIADNLPEWGKRLGTAIRLRGTATLVRCLSC